MFLTLSNHVQYPGVVYLSIYQKLFNRLYFFENLLLLFLKTSVIILSYSGMSIYSEWE